MKMKRYSIHATIPLHVFVTAKDAEDAIDRFSQALGSDNSTINLHDLVDGDIEIGTIEEVE